MTTNGKNKKFSMKGLLFSILVSIILVIITQVLIYKFNITFIDDYFFIGWLLYGFGMTFAYQFFSTEGEKFWYGFIIGLVNLIVIQLGLYVSDVVVLMTIHGEKLGDIFANYSLINFFEISFAEEVTLINGDGRAPVAFPGWLFQIASYIFILLIPTTTIFGEAKKNKA